MIVTFPKEITNFIDTGIAVLRDVKQNSELLNFIDPVKTFNNNFLQELILLKSSIPSGDETFLPLDKLIAFTRRREKLINKIDKSLKENNKEVLQEVIGEFLHISNGIQLSLFDLTEKISHLEPITSIGIIDDFLRLAGTLSSREELPFEKILEKLASLKEFKNNMSGEFGFFLRLYPEYRELQDEVNIIFSNFTTHMDSLSLLLYEKKEKEPVLEEIEKFTLLLKQIPIIIDKVDKIRKEKSDSRLPALDMLEKTAQAVTEKRMKMSEFEYLFFYLLNLFRFSLEDLSNLHTHSLLREKTIEKYYPFLEEKAGILNEKALTIINLFKTFSGKELIFRDEPELTPCGLGKFNLFLQFIALGVIHLHVDSYSIDRDIFLNEIFSSLPLPEYKRNLEVTEKEEHKPLDMGIKKPPSFTIPFTPNISQNIKKTVPVAGTLNKVPQNQMLKEVKKEPVKTWDPKGYFVSDKSTDSLLNSALNRLKGGK